VIRANISDKKVSTKMEPSKDFGSFSALLAPALLTGKVTAAASDEDAADRRLASDKLSSSLTNLSKLSTSSQLKADRKEDSFNYSSSYKDKYEANNNSSSYAEDNNNSVNRFGLIFPNLNYWGLIKKLYVIKNI
jgi:hypothetical protein